MQQYLHAAGTNFSQHAETVSAACGILFLSVRKPFPQYAGSVPARCGFRSVRKTYPLAAEPFPWHAEIVSAACGYNFRSVRTRFGIYFSATVGTTVRWARFRRTCPLGVSTRYDLGVSAEPLTCPGEWLLSVVTQTSVPLGISGRGLVPWRVS